MKSPPILADPFNSLPLKSILPLISTILPVRSVISPFARRALPKFADRTIVPIIEKAFKRGKPKAVALVINSPGGSPVQSALIAARIRTLGEQHGVPLFSAPPLARALYRSTEIGQEIPARLYTAVAQVLAYIYQLRQTLKPGQMPPEPPVPEVDEDEFRK